MYAKLTEGVLYPAPAMLRTEQGDIYNPTADILAAAGFKPVTEAPYPETEEESPVTYMASYEETEDEILQVWSAITQDQSK